MLCDRLTHLRWLCLITYARYRIRGFPSTCQDFLLMCLQLKLIIVFQKRILWSASEWLNALPAEVGIKNPINQSNGSAARPSPSVQSWSVEDHQTKTWLDVLTRLSERGHEPSFNCERVKGFCCNEKWSSLYCCMGKKSSRLQSYIFFKHSISSNVKWGKKVFVCTSCRWIEQQYFALSDSLNLEHFE